MLANFTNCVKYRTHLLEQHTASACTIRPPVYFYPFERPSSARQTSSPPARNSRSSTTCTGGVTRPPASPWRIGTSASIPRLKPISTTPSRRAATTSSSARRPIPCRGSSHQPRHPRRPRDWGVGGSRCLCCQSWSHGAGEASSSRPPRRSRRDALACCRQRANKTRSPHRLA